VETVQIDTWIRGSGAACFDAARDLDLHVQSLAHTKEKAVGGRMSGLIELGDEVTWRGRHFGVYQTFTSKITAFSRPHHFQDTMQRGAFKTFVHDHYFTTLRDGTAMKDVLTFSAPLGILGRLAERIVLRGYLERLLTSRAAAIKEAVELRRQGAARVDHF
jgi:ligand-binding SRPBCC domain-containing protein